MTIHSELLLSSKKASLYATTFGWVILARMRTSLSELAFSLALSFTILTYFKAYYLASDFLSAR